MPRAQHSCSRFVASAACSKHGCDHDAKTTVVVVVVVVATSTSASMPRVRWMQRRCLLSILLMSLLLMSLLLTQVLSQILVYFTRRNVIDVLDPIILVTHGFGPIVLVVDVLDPIILTTTK